MENKSSCVSPEACAPTGVGWSTTSQPSCVSPEACAPTDVGLSTTSQPVCVPRGLCTLRRGLVDDFPTFRNLSWWNVVNPFFRFRQARQTAKSEAILIVERVWSECNRKG